MKGGLILTQVHFLNLPYLSTDYSNVIDFENIVSRDNFFKRNIKLDMQCNIKYDGERTVININKSAGEMMKYDYLFFKGNNKY